MARLSLLPVWARGLARLARHKPERRNWLHEWRRRLIGEPGLPSGAINSVLVLCHGNICRSPFAERLLAARQPAIEVRSAGLEAHEGNPADPEAQRAALAFGVRLDDHRSARVDTRIVEEADLILAMEGHQHDCLVQRWPGARSRTLLLGDFLPRGPHRIPDPWGREPQVFRATFSQIAGAVARLAERLSGEPSHGAPSTGQISGRIHRKA